LLLCSWHFALLFFRHSKRDRARRSIGIERRRRWRELFTATLTTAASAAASSATTARIRHDHEVLTSLGLIADGHATRAPVEHAGPEHLTGLLIVRAHLPVVARVEDYPALRYHDAV